MATNMDLSDILIYLYPQYSWYNVDFGGPDWTERVGFDINAVATGNPSRETLDEMARQLLKDRFGLQFHVEERPMDVYAMVVARTGSLGRGLTPAAFDCTMFFASRARGEAPPPVPPPSGGKPSCGMTTSFEGQVMRVQGGGVTLDRVASFMEGFGMADRRPIIDRTGLTGRYDVDMKFTIYNPRPSVSVSLPREPMMKEAMEEYLGLRLEPRREQRETLVIDRVNMPTPN
jgi:uncharacterized protein (TIGR03435 family)